MVIIITIDKKLFKQIFSSLRFKIFFSFTVVSILSIILLSVSLIYSFKSHYIEDKTSIMYRDANTIAANLVVTGYFDDALNNSFFQTIDAMVEGRTVVLDASYRVIYDSNNNDVGRMYVTEHVVNAIKDGNSSNQFFSEHYFGQVITPIVDFSRGNTVGAIVITESFSDVKEAVSDMVGLACVIAVAIIILFLAFSFYASALLTKPLGQIISYIKKVSRGHRGEKLAISGNYEVQEISESFNRLLKEIWEAESIRQQFVANVSHELKTPLSSIKVLAESLLSQENVPEELYREFLQDINHEVNRETDIINDLLTIVTLNKKGHGLEIKKESVNELIEKILRRLKPLADKKHVQIIFESYRQVEAEFDEQKLESVISNLVDNAIKYNRDYGSVKVTLNANHQDVQISVKDTGVGIPKESAERVFKRFYRVDKTRSRDTGGTGLGLSIVSDIIKMHHGSVKCISDGENGTTFELTLPLTQTVNVE